MRFFIHTDRILFEDIEWLYSRANFNTVDEISLKAGVNDGHILMLYNRGLPPLTTRIELDENTITANGVDKLLKVIPTDRYFELVLSDCKSLFSDSFKLCAEAMRNKPTLVIKISGENIDSEHPLLKEIDSMNQSREPNKPEKPERGIRQISAKELIERSQVTQPKSF